MADIVGYKKMGGFSNELQHVEMVYDFAADGGAAGTLVMGEMEKDVVIVRATIFVEEAVTGLTSIKMGCTSDDDAFLTAANGIPATLVADYLDQEAAGQLLKIPAGDFVNAVIVGTGTAGKVKLALDFFAV